MRLANVLSLIMALILQLLVVFFATTPTRQQEEARAMPIVKITEKPKPAPSKKVNKKAKRRKTRGIKLGTFKITAYCPCNKCSEGYGKVTATGTIARAKHTIAVDPKVIKYGTKIKIGSRTYTAEDCGGGVRGRHIDIYFNNHADVERYGVKYKKVRVRNDKI